MAISRIYGRDGVPASESYAQLDPLLLAPDLLGKIHHG